MRSTACCLALLALASCRGREFSVTLAGSTAFQPFAEILADDFMVLRPELNVTVQGGGSAVGIAAADSGAAQIGMADLVELPKEAASLQAIVVARDGIAIAVNPKNAAAGMTVEEIKRVFSGFSRNWKEFGGRDAPITVVSREAGSGTRTSFEKILKGLELAPSALIQDSNGTIRETVANDENAVGYISQSLVSEKVKALAVGGVACTVENIVAGTYPLVRPIYLLTKGAAKGAAKDFIEYVLGPEGQGTIAKNGLIPAK
jgi:phosphate transport system substrate-binding protein